MSAHSPNCDWRDGKGRPCREYSTDGTLLGAEIAHTMGTTSEREIIENNWALYVKSRVLTGMEEEQADWEGEE